jgi:hypothetical protein
MRQQVARGQTGRKQRQQGHRDDGHRPSQHEDTSRLLTQAREPERRGADGGHRDHEHAAPHRGTLEHAQPVTHRERGEREEDR